MNKVLDKIQGFMPDAEFLQTAEMAITFAHAQATYVMPSDFFFMNQIRIDSETRVLDPYSHEDFDRRHPDPANEAEDVPSDYTFEFDRVNQRHILRIAPTPDAAYAAHGIMRRWHQTLTGIQGIQYDKLETALEEGAIYEGSKSIYADNEYLQYRAELKTSFLESTQALQQILMQQKPHPRQIRTVLRKGDY